MILRILTIVVTIVHATPVHAAIVEHFNVKEKWQAAVGLYDTIDFTGLPAGTFLSDQYASQGVFFEGFVFIDTAQSYVNDGWGFNAPGGTWLHFDEPIQWFAAEHPGFIKYDFYRNGELLATSEVMFGYFSGVILSEPFDAIYLYKPFPLDNWVFVDDIHFGPPIPAPGALGLFALVLIGARRRRKRS